MNEVTEILLTTERAESSYGRPVLVIDGDAFGPADLTPAGVTAAELVNDWAARFVGPIGALGPDVDALAELIIAAREMLRVIDHITTDDFQRGAERAERERLRAILARLLRIPADEVTRTPRENEAGDARNWRLSRLSGGWGWSIASSDAAA